MPRFAANLSMLWQELDPYDRFAAAASAGFSRVEMLFPHELEATRLAKLLRGLDLEMVVFDPAAGDWANGERGLLCLPSREGEFLETLRAAIELAQRIGTHRLNALVGVLPAGSQRDEGWQVAVDNLQAAVPLVEAARLTLLVEAINSVDMPGYVADTIDRAAELGHRRRQPSGSSAVRPIPRRYVWRRSD